MSAAKVDEWLHADKGSPWAKHANGGIVGFDDGGVIAPTVQTMNPMTQGMIQRYSSLPVEKLQEMAAQMGGSPQGAMIRQVLQQKMAMPAQQQPMQQAGASAQANGGIVPKRAVGGSEPATPWWTRREAEQPGASGFLGGSTLGRADAVRTMAPGGSYVMPADVVAGLGEGNSLAGARIMQEAISSGPWGTPQERQGQGQRSLPHPTAPVGEAKGGFNPPGIQRPVLLSHGEFVISNEDVARIGGGDMKKGHRILDKFVVEQRKKQIAQLKKLPGPVINVK